MFSDADRRFFDTSNPGLSRREVIEDYLKYVSYAKDTQLFGSSTPNVIKPLHNFFNGCNGNKFYKVKVRSVNSTLIIVSYLIFFKFTFSS